MAQLRVHLIAAARPNFMKIAPLYHALARESWCRPQIVHTGQHYDANMSDAFFHDLSLPAPDHFLGVGSGSRGSNFARFTLKKAFTLRTFASCVNRRWARAW